MVKYLIIFLLLCVASIGCEQQQGDEVQRTTSPDGVLDAVMTRDGGSATVGESFQIFIVPKGKTIDKLDKVFLADKVDDLKFVWQGNGFLTIRYKKARIFQFSNFWHSAQVKNFAYLVEVKLDLTTPSALR